MLFLPELRVVLQEPTLLLSIHTFRWIFEVGLAVHFWSLAEPTLL